MNREIRLAVTFFVVTTWFLFVARDRVAGEPEGECADVPRSGTYLLVADAMIAPGAAMGGGIDLPYVDVVRCGASLTASLAPLEKELKLSRIGTSFESVESHFKKKNGYLEKYVKGQKNEKAKEALILEVVKAFLRRPFLLPPEYEAKKELGIEMPPAESRNSLFDSNFSAYYAGSLPHEERIFFILGVAGTEMRSVSGFAFLNDTGAEPPPPFVQAHEWRFVRGTKLGDEEKQAKLKELQEAFEWAARENQYMGILEILMKALGSQGI